MGMFDQIKDVMKMRSEAKRVQNEIQKISATYSNGGITVTAKGDMTIASISVTPEAYDEVKAGKPSVLRRCFSTSSMAHLRRLVRSLSRKCSVLCSLAK